ncbi:RidA family protein [Vibrio sp. L5-1]|uniref:RidA family protein n=1 Tax=unclassified Vibrio TaxID=2614977 RepID=UPI001F186FB4|nr:RidA family protein [Vibrio sp. L5-1]
MEFINTACAKQPNGHYSQATLISNTLYISAQLPDTAASVEKKDMAKEVERQTRSVLNNTLALTQAAGGTLQSIALVRFYSTDVKYWPILDQTFADFMGEHKPARAVICVASIKQDFWVMAEAIAEITMPTAEESCDGYHLCG